MTEESLATLFSELPKECVVLLEDIDTAGLTHTRQTPEEEIKNVPTSPRKTTGISLSALLNVIDGVASQEGRILIMTTNHIEKLDEALIRPGRVDMTIKFDLADSMMVKTLFKGIFATLEGDFPKSLISKDKTDLNMGKSATATNTSVTEIAAKEAEEADISALADDFAAIIPSHTFSPVEIQGFLLKHKRDTAIAVSGGEKWVKETLAQKEKSKKLEQEKKDKDAG
jgi:chaperone BCS1